MGWTVTGGEYQRTSARVYAVDSPRRTCYSPPRLRDDNFPHAMPFVPRSDIRYRASSIRLGAGLARGEVRGAGLLERFSLPWRRRPREGQRQIAARVERLGAAG